MTTAAGPIESWSASANWPFHPSGDGETCQKTNEAKHYIEVLGHTRIICPLRQGGYVYGYANGQFVRRGLPKYQLSEEFAALVSGWERKCPSIEMRESETSQALAALNRWLQRAVWGELPASWDTIRPEAMTALATRLRRCKNVRADVLPTLKRLGELYEQGLPTASTPLTQ